jgi:hypothetical protein
MPAVVLVLVVGLAALQLAGEQLRLQSAAGDAARLIARGDGGAAAVIQRVSPGASFTQRADGELTCVDARAAAGAGVLAAVTLSATSCALRDDG